jgi:hypothetical protein
LCGQQQLLHVLWNHSCFVFWPKVIIEHAEHGHEM